MVCGEGTPFLGGGEPGAKQPPEPDTPALEKGRYRSDASFLEPLTEPQLVPRQSQEAPAGVSARAPTREPNVRQRVAAVEDAKLDYAQELGPHVRRTKTKATTRAATHYYRN